MQQLEPQQLEPAVWSPPGEDTLAAAGCEDRTVRYMLMGRRCQAHVWDAVYTQSRARQGLLGAASLDWVARGCTKPKFTTPIRAWRCQCHPCGSTCCAWSSYDWVGTAIDARPPILQYLVCMQQLRSGALMQGLKCHVQFCFWGRIPSVVPMVLSVPQYVAGLAVHAADDWVGTAIHVAIGWEL